MSNINLRQSTAVSADDTLLNRPLSNAEVDSNFINLNQDKLEKDGSIAANYLNFTDQISNPAASDNIIWYDSSNGRFHLNNDLFVSGDITASGLTNYSIVTVEDGIELTLDNASPYQVTSFAEASGGGINIGWDTYEGRGFVSLLYNNTDSAWVASKNDGSDIDFIANDFRTDVGSISLKNTNALLLLVDSTVNGHTTDINTAEADIDRLESRVGINSGSPNFGWSNTSTDNATEEPVIAETTNEDLKTLVDKINTAMLNVVSEIRHTSATSISASSGVMYLITPTADAQTFTISLPTSNKGRIAFRLEDAEDAYGVSLGYAGTLKWISTASAPIEGLDTTGSQYYSIAVTDKVIEFIWDSVSSVWRVIEPINPIDVNQTT